MQRAFKVLGHFTFTAPGHVKAAGVKRTAACNALSTEYAADSYARVGSLRALFTTHSVGELSLINAAAEPLRWVRASRDRCRSIFAKPRLVSEHASARWKGYQSSTALRQIRRASGEFESFGIPPILTTI